MSVRSSTSNFDVHLSSRAVPDGNWLPSLLVGVAAMLSFAGWMEFQLARRGFEPTIIDTNVNWANQRERVSALGTDALTIIGASRAQLDLDLSVLHTRSGLQPVQLAIDGSSMLPVLEGLADDPRVSGTIVVDFQASDLTHATPSGQSATFERTWERRSHKLRLPDFTWSEAALTAQLDDRLRIYADGTRPITSLLQRIGNSSATPQYLQTLSTRERVANYALTPMPNFYFGRVNIELTAEGGKPPRIENYTTWDELDKAYSEAIADLRPADTTIFDRNLERVATMVDRLQKRGARVIFAVLPTSGFISEIEHRRYPRNLFAAKVAAVPGVEFVETEDSPAFRGFVCPDGSHLDGKDRHAFTEAFAKLLWP